MRRLFYCKILLKNKEIMEYNNIFVKMILKFKQLENELICNLFSIHKTPYLFVITKHYNTWLTK